MKQFILDKRNWQYFLFWSWNAIFLVFMILGFAPTIMVELGTAVRAGSIPVQFLVFGGILALIPLLCVILGATILRKAPDKLFSLGYGIEGPLMLLLAIRFFVIRDATPIVTFLLGTMIFGLGVLLWQLLDSRIEKRGLILSHIRVIGLTLLLVMGFIASLWIAFYALPLAKLMIDFIVEVLSDLGFFIESFIDNLRQGLTEALLWVPFMISGMLLMGFTATLFVLAPIVIPIIYGRAWWAALRALTRHTPKKWAAAWSTAVVAFFFLGFYLLNQQPQHEAFALLENPPTTEAEAETLLENEEAIRAGLLNSYLAQHRYLGAKGEVYHINDMYQSAFDLTPAQGRQVQGWYEQLTSPLLYQPVDPIDKLNFNIWDNRAIRTESAKAAKLYEQFFDQPIAEGEKETVVKAVRATWMPDQARAGWQAVDDREIYLAQQEINISEHGDWAEVELYEVYENQTAQRQEVVYFFTLPETAVLTGVWLGNSDDRDERFEFRVAPRGAAQAVYRQEVNRRVDPALLEQIGPSQYRLRVFPVPPMTWDWDDESDHSFLSDGQPLHMWLTYQVMADGDTWSLPYLAKQFNVFWDSDTVRFINDQPLEPDKRNWLPASAPVQNPAAAATHLVTFADGTAVVAGPVTETDLPQPAADLTLAVVLDRSRSMAKQATAVQEALAEVAAWAAEADIYLTATEFRGESPSVVPLAEVDAANLVYFGGQNAGDLLLQFEDIYKGQAYDAILVLTDGSGFGLSFDGREPAIPNAPLWMIHLSGDYPLGYDDATLEAIQASQGGSVASVSEALTRQLIAQQAPDGQSATLVNGILWQTMAAETAVADFPGATSHQAGADFARLAARQHILAEMYQRKGDLSDLEVLDSLHAIAQDQGIVTPYSSMIVLVEERQQRLLDQMEDDADRFEREFEEVGETQEELTVTGVPEPEEWLLIGLTAVMLAWYLYKNRQTKQERRYA